MNLIEKFSRFIFQSAPLTMCFVNIILLFFWKYIAYLSRPENYNVILMDWSEMGPFPWYRQAVQNGKLIGKVLKDFIEVFHDSGEIPIGSLHIIGFSLGGHIASHAGKQLRRGLKIPRITALDPAFPDFPLRGKGLERKIKILTFQI